MTSFPTRSRPRGSPRAVLPRRVSALDLVALLLLLLAAAAGSLRLSRTHGVPVYDEVSYLDQARDFRARGSLGTAACYLAGECRDDNRHPLYALLASSSTDGGPED